ncbi:MAG: DUF1553 domain-containing protein [bacterium]|nr:DUF1553 domain-containing protein [bacterium]
MLRYRLLHGIIITAVLALPAAAVDFQHDVRPLLSDNCFLCHGPDPETRMVGLRLDVREGAFGERDNGVPVVPGKPEESLVYQRLIHKSAVLRMPPKYSHKELNAEEIETIRSWIEQGAPWSEHWAFVTPKRSAPPAVKKQDWARNPIDRFIGARLEAAGLEPAPEADRRTLIRRVSLDITGLPPDPRDVDAFVEDSRPDAYENLVDRLLASPAYGEHRARYWLDAARYADTHGLHIDNYREMWPYRDWVIAAFNRNLPFDRFTVEQLAGDLLEDPSANQLIASGFHRCNITTNEGGVIDEEVAADYAKDRVDTTGTVWLGLTVGCATCHDHKFDPITQREFYSLAAFFRNTTQHPRDGNVFDTPPVIVVPEKAYARRWAELRDEIPAAKKNVDRIRAEAMDEIEIWLRSKERRLPPPVRFDTSETLSIEFSKQPVLHAGNARPLALPKQVSTRADALWFDDKQAYIEVPGAGGLTADGPFTVAVRFFLPQKGGRTLVSQSDRDDEDRGWWLDVSGNLPRLTLVGNDGDQLGVRATKPDKLKPDQWHHAVFSYDGHRQRSGMAIYIDGRPVATEAIGNVIRVLEGVIKTGQPLRLGCRLREIDEEDEEANEVSGFENGALADFRIFRRVISEPEARLLALWGELREARRVNRPTGRQREALELDYLVRRHQPYREAISELAALEAEAREIRRRSPVTHVQQERTDSMPMAHVLHRGMYDQPRDKVEPTVPAVLPPMRESYPRNRLGLAKWLLDDANPLTARVTVNRFWQEVFGTGIVETAEDFGSQGAAPSHPELLDWLAVDFRESGWDIKRLFRMMVTSATYRQVSAATEQKLEVDPNNRLLSRGPRFRLDGEVVRDYALAASGLLVHHVGGPSVKPYQPDGLWEAVAMKESNTRFFKPDHGSNLHRRSLYTFWKRSAPPPSLQIFNAPTREHCTVRRERTNTPLQALVTMNDPQFFEAARHLAQNAMRSSDEFDGRLGFLAARLLARQLTPTEQPVAHAAYKDFLSYYDSNPAEARRALAVGESEPDASLGAAEFAALTMLANQLMNLDEVLNK